MRCAAWCKDLIFLLAWYQALGLASAPGVCAQPPITAVAFAPDGQHVLLGSQAGIVVRSWPELSTTERKIPTELAHVHDLAFAPDGQRLLAAGGSPGEAGVVEVLSWPEAKLLGRISKHDDLVYRVAWSPGGNEWASASGDGICQVFSSETHEVQVRYEGHSRAVLGLCYLPDGQAIASAGCDQTIQLWDSRSGARQRTLDNHLAAINDIAVRPFEVQTLAASNRSAALPQLASVSDDRTVRLWQPTIGRMVRFAKLPSSAQALAWTPKGDRILAGCIDGRVRVIDPETAAICVELGGSEERIYSLAVEPGGSRIVVAGDGEPFIPAR